MQLFLNNSDKRKTVIFIHGFGKNYTDFNQGITQSGNVKNIKIEEALRKTHNTILINIEDEDYKQNINVITNDIYEGIKSLLSTNIIIVAHSYGCFYAINLVETYHLGSLLLIEPVVKSEKYLSKLKTEAINKDENTVEYHKFLNYDYLPNGDKIRNNITVRVHINSKGEIKNLKYLDQLTNKNANSRLIVHYNVSHMIHYFRPQMILSDIKELSNKG